jgi:hypothetical protein
MVDRDLVKQGEARLCIQETLICHIQTSVYYVKTRCLTHVDTRQL